MRLFCTLLLFVSSIAGSQTAKLLANCEPSRSIERELQRLETRENLPHLKQKAILEELLAKHPDDLAVQMRYQDFVRSRQRKDELQILIDKYRQLAADAPNDPQDQYLDARALTGTDSLKAVQILQTSLAKFPAYPWPHLGLASIYSLRGEASNPGEGPFTNPDKAQKELGAFLEACPGTLNEELWHLAEKNANLDAAPKYISQLRNNLTRNSSSIHVSLWPIVWDLELKWSDHEVSQKRITEDLKRLEQMRGRRDVPRLLALRQGYKLLADTDSTDRVELELIAGWPNDAQVRQLFIDRWWNAHLLKSEKEADVRDFNAAYVKMAEEQVKLFPENSRLWLSYVMSLGQLPGSSPAEIGAAGDGLLNAVHTDTMAWRYYPSAEFYLARIYLKKKVRLETIPTLMEKGLAYQKEHTFESDLNKKDPNFDVDSELGPEIEAADLLTDAAQILHRPEMARAAVVSLQNASPKNGYLKFILWQVRAKFAELEGRKLDALALYRMALQERPAHANVGDHDELTENEQRLWKELGGTDEGYPLGRAQTAAVEAAKEEDWAKPAKTMTDWALPDLQGKRWQLSDFRGKVLLINVWATWCVPCQEELPYLQKLYDRIKDRTDVQILTFNIDEEVANTMVFEKKMGYTFPVLLAQGHQEALDINSGRGIPRNWIVDGGGKWVWDRQTDFKLDDTLPDQILAKMESAKSK